MKSSWDETKRKSAYHFEPRRRDARWDAPIGLGKFVGDWTAEVEQIIASSRASTWETRGYKGEGNPIPSPDLAAEEYDLSRVGVDPKQVVSHLSWTIPPKCQQMADLFALDDAMVRAHVQMPGEMWHLHIDKLDKWCKEDPNKVMRIFIQLTDWQPGQFWEFGNYHYNQWTAGDTLTFDWPNIPHSTANAGHHPRVTLQVTGVITDATTEFLKKFKNTTDYNIV